MIQRFSGLAVARRDLTGLDFIHHLGRLGVEVEQGARTILASKPGNRLNNRLRLAGMQCASSDPLNMDLREIAERAGTELSGKVIPPHLVPIACYEMVRELWPREYPSLVVFHEPEWIGGYLSVLRFRREVGGRIILDHTDARGMWYTPQTLFAFALPIERR